MKFTNRQFGEMELEEKHIVDFPDGIIGFGEYRKFLIVDDVDSQPFRWLVSLEDEDLSFAMIDPALVVEDYQSRLFRGLDATIFILVAIKNPIEASTMNLRSPIVIDNGTRQGRQVILEDELLSIKHPLFNRRTELVG
jgi:flagellar assembly factor FliW